MNKKNYASNPILPMEHFVPDVEGHQWLDGRMYAYGSYDIKGRKGYCSTKYHVFSSADLIHWVDHGECFHSAGPCDDVPWSDADLYAPDCAYKNGKYYLYFCLSDGSEGVAVSDSPYGPFKDARKIDGMEGIDPAVFIDDDGQAYIYWGQFDNVRAARLKPNMVEIDKSTIVQPLSVAEHNFHEGSSVRKRNGIYYYVFADTSRHGGRPTCLGYATSNSPLGPFQYRGVIIDNYGCDPAVWNNHGSIAEFNGQWYVFYHRSTRGSEFSRRVCIEPIYFNKDGTIPEVEMTSQGIGGPIPAFNQIEAEIACKLSGAARIDDCSDGGESVYFISDGDYAVYKYIDFGTGISRFKARASCDVDGGKIEIRLDSETGPLIGICNVMNTGKLSVYQEHSCHVEKINGIHALYLKYVADNPGRGLSLDWFEFL